MTNERWNGVNLIISPWERTQRGDRNRCEDSPWFGVRGVSCRRWSCSPARICSAVQRQLPILTCCMLTPMDPPIPSVSCGVTLWWDQMSTLSGSLVLEMERRNKRGGKGSNGKQPVQSASSLRKYFLGDGKIASPISTVLAQRHSGLVKSKVKKDRCLTYPLSLIFSIVALLLPGSLTFSHD